MAKVFFSYQQQIEKLVKEKDLLIADEEYAKEIIQMQGLKIGFYQSIYRAHDGELY